MNDIIALREKFIKKAIVDFGFELESGIYWFVDEKKIYYANVVDNTVIHYIHGNVFGEVFKIDFMSSEDELDKVEWKEFIERYLEISCVINL